MLYNLMDNVKTMMDSHLKNKGDISKIGIKDVDKVIEYIKDSKNFTPKHSGKNNFSIVMEKDHRHTHSQ